MRVGRIIHDTIAFSLYLAVNFSLKATHILIGGIFDLQINSAFCGGFKPDGFTHLGFDFQITLFNCGAHRTTARQEKRSQNNRSDKVIFTI